MAGSSYRGGGGAGVKKDIEECFRMVEIFDYNDIERLRGILDGAQRVVCVGHVNPDGDALGVTLAIKHWLERRGKDCVVVMPNRFPDFLAWMPGAQDIVVYDRMADSARAAIEGADLLCICDMNGPERVQNVELEGLLVSCGAVKLMVDHHLEPSDCCSLTASRPEMCASCEVLCHLMAQLGELESCGADVATCIYTGMMTDTGAFSYNSNRAVVFECIARLIGLGIDKDRIYRNVFWTSSMARMRLVGYMLYVKLEVLSGLNACIMSLTNEERRMLGVKNGDTEGIVNMPLQMRDMRLSIFMSEDTEHVGVVRISLRSVGDFPCNEMSARFFGGGGHKNAAGGRLACGMEEAMKIVSRAVEEYRRLLV